MPVSGIGCSVLGMPPELEVETLAVAFSVPKPDGMKSSTRVQDVPAASPLMYSTQVPPAVSGKSPEFAPPKTTVSLKTSGPTPSLDKVKVCGPTSEQYCAVPKSSPLPGVSTPSGGATRKPYEVMAPMT